MQISGPTTGYALIPATVLELDDRYGGKVETMLAHWLDDEDLAARLRPPVMRAISQNRRAFDPEMEAPDDWIFGEARRQAKELIGPDEVAGVIPVMRKPFASRGTTEPEPAPLRQSPPRGRRAVPRRWIWFSVFMSAMLGIIGHVWMNLADRPYVHVATVRPAALDYPAAPTNRPTEKPMANLPRLDAEADAVTSLPPAMAEPAMLPALLAEPVPAPLEPLRAPPPPALADPAPILADLQATSVSPVSPTAAARVFIHYSAADPNAGPRAELLAELLRTRGYPVAGIVQVPFQIDHSSVRYYFKDNMADADALVALSSTVPKLAGLAERGPSDFTGYTPKPRPGTMEIWVASG